MQTIAGGMDALPIALYKQMPEVVRFGTEVRAMEQDDRGVTVHCRVGSDSVSFSADYAICTVPFSVLRPIEHRFSHEKERAIRQLNYPPSDDTMRRGVLLASYTWGQDALQWGAMDEPTRIAEALDDVERIHPGIRDVFEVGASHAWYGDKWARGAFALFAPEQQTSLQRAIVQPEGRIYFAGEHCSLYHAWIQGAIESALQVSRQIHELPAAA
jgi:monoamine oxidase